MIVEICVGDVPGAVVAEQAGADRVELCADLAQGGTTPSLGTIAVALQTLRRVALRVMIRPRGGDFRMGELEQRVMLADIEAVRALPNPHDIALGVVFGATRDSILDISLVRRLVTAAAPLPVTVHKAFDEVADQFEALEQLVALGVDAVLTSGAAPTALEGAGRIAALRARAAGRLQVMAGGGIRAHNVFQVLGETGVDAVHLKTSDGQQVRRVVAEVRQFPRQFR